MLADVALLLAAHVRLINRFIFESLLFELPHPGLPDVLLLGGRAA